MTIARCDLVPSYFYSFLTANAFYFLVEQIASEVAPRGNHAYPHTSPPLLVQGGTSSNVPGALPTTNLS